MFKTKQKSAWTGVLLIWALLGGRGVINTWKQDRILVKSTKSCIMHSLIGWSWSLESTKRNETEDPTGTAPQYLHFLRVQCSSLSSRRGHMPQPMSTPTFDLNLSGEVDNIGKQKLHQNWNLKKWCRMMQLLPLLPSCCIGTNIVARSKNWTDSGPFAQVYVWPHIPKQDLRCLLMKRRAQSTCMSETAQQDKARVEICRNRRSNGKIRKAVQDYEFTCWTKTCTSPPGIQQLFHCLWTVDINKLSIFKFHSKFNWFNSKHWGRNRTNWWVVALCCCQCHPYRDGLALHRALPVSRETLKRRSKVSRLSLGHILTFRTKIWSEMARNHVSSWLWWRTCLDLK